MVSLPKGRKAVAVFAAASSLAGGFALFASPASATTSSLVSVTGVSPHLVAAMTNKQVITITGTGFDEANIASVSIDKCTESDGNGGTVVSSLPYIVTSPTTLVLKTTAACAAGIGTVTITDTASSPATAVSVPGSSVSGAMYLEFKTPPTLASTNPVIENNTAGQATAAQIKTAPTTGGTTIKVTAGSNKFFNSSSYPLTATLGGTAVTNLKPIYHTTNAGETQVDAFTATVPAHVAGTVPLTVVSGGITTTFTATQTGFSYAGTAITSLTPNYGPSDGANKIKIMGSGFTSGSVVTVCGVNAPLSATAGDNTATQLVVTVPAITVTTPGTDPVDGVCTVKVATAGVNTIVNQNSTYTYVAQG